MIDSLKKTMLAGIGAAVITKEKVEAALNDYVAQGKISAADARTMAGKIATEARQEFEDVGDQLAAKLKELLARFDAETRDRISALETRVNVLEQAAKRSSSGSKKS